MHRSCFPHMLMHVVCECAVLLSSTQSKYFSNEKKRKRATHFNNFQLQRQRPGGAIKELLLAGQSDRVFKFLIAQLVRARH